MERINQMKKIEVVKELKRVGLSTKGNANECKQRLQHFYEDMANNSANNSIIAADENVAHIDKMIKEKEEELRLLRIQLESQSNQVSQNETQNTNGDHDETKSQHSGRRPVHIQRNGHGDTLMHQSSRIETNNVRDDQHKRRDERDSSMQRLRKTIDEMLQDEKDEEDEKMASRSANSFSAFSFRDIEHAINSFTGTGNYRIETWIEEFEDYAEMFGWNDLQKVIYAKRVMKDSAKLFLRTVKTTTYSALKRELLKEFGKKLSSGEVHKLLRSKQKKSDENMRDYTLKMREIGVSNDIDEKSVIQYIIDGIDDEQSNKIMLYGAKSYEELKVKLDDYEKYKTACGKNKEKVESSRLNNKQRSSKEQSGGKKNSSNKEPRCYLCGDTSHTMKDCPTKDKGAKCFKCSEFGHKASDNICKKNDSKTDAKTDGKKIMCINEKPRAMKEIKLNGFKLQALIDTGSDINAVRKSIFDSLKINFKIGIMREFTGAGGSTIKAERFFVGNLFIDDQDFESPIYIVNDSDIPIDIVIGNELIFDNSLTMVKGEIKLQRIESEMQKEEKSLFCMLMTEKDEKTEVPEVVKPLIDNYSPKKIKNEETIQLEVQLSDDIPVYEPPRRLPIAHREAVEKQIDEWVKDGIIKPGNSPYACNVVVVKKKDNSNRVCIDYRPLNKKLIKDRYPSPLIDDILDSLQGAVVFSTIDLKNGFFHVPVAEESQKLLAFVTHRGQYLPLKAPFGCSNSPAVFQRHLNHVFRQLIKDGIVLIYMDDIVILAMNEEEAVQRLKRVLKVASEAGLEIKWKKCQFLKRSIEFLGHIIENGCIRPSPDKSEAVQKFKEPKTLKQLFQLIEVNFNRFWDCPDISVNSSKATQLSCQRISSSLLYDGKNKS